VNDKRIVVVIMDDDDNDNTTSGGPRPNAYWARVREQEAEADLEPDTYGGGFRGVPAAPHGGAATVTEANVLGDIETCWCGLPAGHDWPGKASGRKHPREVVMNTQVATRVDRRDLRAYHARLQDFIIQCINDDELRFRIGKNSVILYPPDGTNPATVYARNSDRQVKQLQKWYVAHVYPSIQAEEKEATSENKAVDAETLAALAEQVNDPVEHPRTREDEDTPRGKDPDPPLAEEVPVAPPLDEEKKETAVDRRERIRAANAVVGDWRPYEREHNGPSPNIETNGTMIRCRLCLDTDHPLLSENPRSAGGHNRIYHTDTSNLHGPEARAKAIATTRNMKKQQAIETAIEVLAGTLGEDSPLVKIKALEKDIVRLTKELRDANAKADTVVVDTGALDAMTKRAEDAEARLALMREALGA
jgi:hypothetical protein